MKHCTYLHRRADTGEVIYIGSGSYERAHSPHGRNSRWGWAVSEAGGYATKILAHWPTRAEAFEHEKFLIACFQDLGAPLCNMGGAGYPLSPETRAKIGASHTGLKMPPCSPETRARMSAAQKGKSPTIETRAKISAALAGRVCSPETREKMRSAQLGKKATPETRAKLRAARKKRTLDFRRKP